MLKIFLEDSDSKLESIAFFRQPILQMALDSIKFDHIAASHITITILHIVKIGNKRSQHVQYFLIKFQNHLKNTLDRFKKMKRKRLGF